MTRAGPGPDAIRRFVEVYRVLKGAYVEAVEDQVLIEAAIRGMLDGLDRYTGYLDLTPWSCSPTTPWVPMTAWAWR